MTTTPASKRRRIPSFTAEVEVDIDAHELEQAGWVYVGDQPGADVASDGTKVLDRVKRWHDDAHTGPWRWCTHDLCLDLRRTYEGG